MLTLAYSLFWVNFVYGIMVKLNIFHHKKFAFLHHAIYFFVMLSLFIATLYEIYCKNFLGSILLSFLFLLLFAMTRFSGKTSNHWKYAILCNLIYTSVFIYLR